MAQEMADEIDKEVLEELLALYGRPGESPLKDVLPTPIGIPSHHAVRAKAKKK
jgi:hypothetical protein